jgi:SOS-response transcriptional repressor LexA
MYMSPNIEKGGSMQTKKLGELIRERRKAVGLRYSELEKKSGLTYAYLKSLEEGERIPKIDTLMRLSGALQTPFHELLSALGVPILGSLNIVPVISRVNAGIWDEAVDQPEVLEWMVSDVSIKGVFGLRVQGDSMTPEFAPGDIIIVDPEAAWDSGSYVIALKGSETIFKQYKVYGKTAVLRPLNTNYEEIVVDKEVQIIGKVVRKIKRY